MQENSGVYGCQTHPLTVAKHEIVYIAKTTDVYVKIHQLPYNNKRCPTQYLSCFFADLFLFLDRGKCVKQEQLSKKSNQ